MLVSQRPYHLPVEWEEGTREEGGGRVDRESREGRSRKTRKEEGTRRGGRVDEESQEGRSRKGQGRGGNQGKKDEVRIQWTSVQLNSQKHSRVQQSLV